MINGKRDIIGALKIAPRTCLSEQNSPGIAHCHAAQSADSERPPGRLVSRRDPALCGSSGTAVAFIAQPPESGCATNPKELGAPALHLITGNSFCFLPAAGRPGDVTWPSISRPPGTPSGPEEPSANVLLQSRLPVETGEFRSRQLRPAVSSGRRIAVEITVVRSDCTVLRAKFSNRFEATIAEK